MFKVQNVLAKTAARWRGRQLLDVSPSPVHEFEIADRTYVQDFGHGWSITFRRYDQAGVFRRRLRCSDEGNAARCRQVLGATVWSLPDASVIDGDECVMQSSIELGLDAIARVLAAIAPRDGAACCPDPVPAEIELSHSRSVEEGGDHAVAPMSAAQTSGPALAAAAHAGPRSEGIVVEAGTVPSPFDGKDQYRALLMLRSGATKEFRGKHLQECFTQLGVNAGDTIAITPAGKLQIAGKFPVNQFLVERMAA